MAGPNCSHNDDLQSAPTAGRHRCDRFPRCTGHSLLLVVIAMAGLAMAAEGDDPSWRLEPLSASVRLEAPSSIHLSNHHGEIHVRPSSGLMVEAQAMSQRHTEDPRRFELVTHRDADDLQLTVESSAFTGDPADSWRKRRIDLTVFVPPTAPLKVESLHDKVHVKGVRADVHATSTSGELFITTHGTVTAMSNYGNIRAELTAPTSNRTHSFETVTGSIEVELPWQAGVQATISTRGVIASDYSIDIRWPHHTQVKTGVIRFRPDTTGLALRLMSERGDVRVLRKLGVDAPHDSSESTQ